MRLSQISTGGNSRCTLLSYQHLLFLHANPELKNALGETALSIAEDAAAKSQSGSSCNQVVAMLRAPEQFAIDPLSNSDVIGTEIPSGSSGTASVAVDRKESNTPENTLYKFKSVVTTYGRSEPILMFEIDGAGGLPIKFAVEKQFIDQNIDAIKKYLKWSAMAKERGDTLDKEIGIVKGFDAGLINYWNAYEISSGFGKHTLHITPGLKLLMLPFHPNLIGEVRSDSYADKVRNRTIILNEDYANRVLNKFIEFKEGKISSLKDSDYQ
jgi:hypothetical protein